MSSFQIERGLIFGFSTTIQTLRRVGFVTDGKIDVGAEVLEKGLLSPNVETHRIVECSYAVYCDADGQIRVEARRDADNKAIGEAIVEIEKRLKSR